MLVMGTCVQMIISMVMRNYIVRKKEEPGYDEKAGLYFKCFSQLKLLIFLYRVTMLQLRVFIN